MRLVPALLLGSLCAFAAPAHAQAFLPVASFSALPAFAWPRSEVVDERWEGSYARMSTGFQVTSSKRLGTYAGPTVGFEGGHLWRDGNLVYGIVGGFDYIAPFGRAGTPAPGLATWTRDVAGVLQVKAGTFVADNLLVYAKLGVSGANETLRLGPSALSGSFSRSDIVVRPDARIGAEWAVTDRITLGIEVGVAGAALR